MTCQEKMREFQGIVIPLYTPWRDGEVDLDMMFRLVEWLARMGIGGLFVNGSSGRCDHLSPATRRLVIKELADFVKGQTPPIRLICHVGSNDPELSLELARHALPYADAIGCKSVRDFDAQQNLHHYAAVGQIAAKGDLPLAIYHLASLGDTGVSTDSIKELADIPNLSGIKYTGSDLWVIRGIWERFLEETGRRLTVFSGADQMFLPWLTLAWPISSKLTPRITPAGIGTTMMLLTEAYRRMMEAFINGQIELASWFQVRINQVIEILLAYGGLSAWEVAMKYNGFEFAEPGPGTPAGLTSSQRTELFRALDAVGIDELTELNVPFAA